MPKVALQFRDEGAIIKSRIHTSVFFPRKAADEDHASKRDNERYETIRNEVERNTIRTLPSPAEEESLYVQANVVKQAVIANQCTTGVAISLQNDVGSPVGNLRVQA